MAINPLSAALAAIQLGAGLSGIRGRMRDRSGQDRIQRLLQQAQARNLRGAQQIAASGEGINPALAQRAALGYLTEANQEAARSAMAQEAAMAERDRARMDRLTGGALGALGSFGAQLLAGQDTSEADSADTKSAMAAMSRQIAAKRAAQPTQTPSLNALETALNEEAEAGAAISPIMTKPPTPGAMPDEDKPPTAPTWGTTPAASAAASSEIPEPQSDDVFPAGAARALPAESTMSGTSFLGNLGRQLDRGHRLGTSAITPQRRRRRPPTPAAAAAPEARSRVQVGPVEVVPSGSPNVEVGPIEMVPPGSPNVEVGPIQVERPDQTTPVSAQQPTMSMPRPMMSMPRSAPTTAAEALMSIPPTGRTLPDTELPPYLLRSQFRMGILPRGPFRRGRAPRMSILPQPHMSIGPR